MKKTTIFNTPVLSPVIYVIIKFFMKIRSWKIEGAIPSDKKFVLIAAPHTSNWDLVITISLAFLFKVKIYWMGKDAMFRFPFSNIMLWLGGIPIDRTKKNNVVQQTIDVFNQNKEMIITIPPEGTRDKVPYWKTGFYHIAHGANVPIVLGFIDFKRKIGGLGPLLKPTGNIAKDMEKIKEFYSKITGKHKHKTSDLEE